jgi:hypothetical protein
MGILRFPNPGSDLNRFLQTFSILYKELKGKTNFSHDDSRDAAIRHGLVSSSGAIGEEAVRRSTRVDRSRDPLYNQLKMYSELYRMLGWLKPGTMNTNFNFTELSHYVAESAVDVQFKIFEECLISIVFPNPLVENKSGNESRPFPIILKVAGALHKVIFRDEIIVGIYPLHSDRTSDTIDKIVQALSKLRGNSQKLLKAKSELSKSSGIEETTLENYTRFPLGIIKGLGWFEAVSVKGVFEKSVKGYVIQTKGEEKLNLLLSMVDVRNEDIKEFAIEIRGSFTLLAHYIFLGRCGFDITAYQSEIEDLKIMSKPILDKCNIDDVRKIFYSPSQQGKDEEIEMANQIEKKYD